MDLQPYLLSVLEQDKAPIVICDLEHIVIYMNTAAKVRYAEDGGATLLGKSLMLCHNDSSNKAILRVVEWFGESADNNIVHTFYNRRDNRDVYMVALRDKYGKLIGYYEKHETRNVDTAPMYELR